MEPIVETWTPNLEVASADLNSIQQLLYALRAANGTNSWSSIPGAQEVAFQSASDIADATLMLIDESIDWRDRIVRGEYLDHTTSDAYPGAANDYDFSTGTLYTFMLYTGTGGLDSGGSEVTNGNPPTSSAGQYAVQIFSGFWIYCDPTTGKLKIYNNTGGAKKTPTVFARCTADLGKR